MSYRMGIDIGGTFTDFALIDDRTGILTIHKQLTTPSDPSVAVLDGAARLLRRAGLSFAELGSIIHGSTLVTNAVIERRGAVTGMLVTEGFSDVLDIAMERRYDIYDLRLRFPAPIVPRAMRAEIAERMQADGSVATALDLDAAVARVGELRERHGIVALAICYLHAFTNPMHEEQTRKAVAAAFPDLYLSSSADVFPFMREYERWNTTAINAYVQPLVDRYLQRIEESLTREGFRGQLHVMTSTGGTVSVATARRYPVRMLESGPAAGVLMSAYLGRLLDLPNVLAFDMGGTTAKGSVIRDGLPRKRYDIEIARVHEFRVGSGLPVKIPVIDMIEIGAGGGSIARIDDRGVIAVGPRSAGADPGPSCYARGGTQPTLTDANLTLGYLDPDYFLGGVMTLDTKAAQNAICHVVAEPLQTEVLHAAWGIHETINEDVTRAFRVHASERGIDYRSCSMIAFGGSGPAHAMRVARKLRIPRVVFPAAAGVLSAIGMLVSPLSFQVASTRRVLYRDLDAAQFAAIFAPLVTEATSILKAAGIADDAITVHRAVDMRYQGQGYELEVKLPQAEPGSVFEKLPMLFSEMYRDVFALSYIDEPVEIMNWKVEAVGPEPILNDGLHLTAPRPGSQVSKGSRRAYFPEQPTGAPCPVYDRYALLPGVTIEGPALIEEQESTCVIGIGDTLRVDAQGNLIAELALEAN
jgi:N-methylhydantoinase A